MVYRSTSTSSQRTLEGFLVQNRNTVCQPSETNPSDAPSPIDNSNPNDDDHPNPSDEPTPLDNENLGNAYVIRVLKLW